MNNNKMIIKKIVIHLLPAIFRQSNIFLNINDNRIFEILFIKKILIIHN